MQMDGFCRRPAGRGRGDGGGERWEERGEVERWREVGVNECRGWAWRCAGERCAGVIDAGAGCFAGALDNKVVDKVCGKRRGRGMAFAQNRGRGAKSVLFLPLTVFTLAGAGRCGSFAPSPI